MAGYPQLSSLMTSHPETAIFRTFMSLNMRNLLYMQAELMHLEKELQMIVQEDTQSHEPKRQALQIDWLSLEKSLGEGGEPDQRTKVLEIRRKLEHYNSALLQVAQLHGLSPPSQHNIALLNEWLQRPDYGKGFLKGVERKTWDLESGIPDHISLSPQHGEGDPLINFLYDFVPGWYHRYIGHRWKKPMAATGTEGAIFEYQNSKLDRVSRTLRTLLSTLLPTSSIFVLYYVRSSPVQLGLILVFTALFALTVQFTSRARPVEIFAATTAFAAVQVVFVGSTLGKA